MKIRFVKEVPFMRSQECCYTLFREGEEFDVTALKNTEGKTEKYQFIRDGVIRWEIPVNPESIIEVQQ